MRALNANSDVGILTKSPETLTNDFFHLLDMNTVWEYEADDTLVLIVAR